MKRIPILAAISIAALAAGCAAQVPEALRPPPGDRLALETTATGVQIYECAASADAQGQYRWVFKAPEADLFDRGGRRIGKHYAGPTWELDDGSKTVGAVKARADAPDANAIPWLLLDAKPAGGRGALTATSSILRLHTVGGTAPATACGAAQAGSQARIAYQATYQYFGKP